MFSILNRKKKINIDFFTSNYVAYTHTPISETKQHYPSWWTSLPNNKIDNIEDALNVARKQNTNMKMCWGFNELYKRGFMIRNWSDVMFETTPDRDSYVAVQSGNSMAPTIHNPNQHNNFFCNSYHAKLESPWAAREKEGIPFLMIGDIYNDNKLNYHVCPGVLQFDIQGTTNVNILFPKRIEKYNFIVPFGQPIAQLIPLRDDVNITFKNHMVEQDFINKLSSGSKATFFSLYGLNRVVKKNKERTCPF